MSRATGSLRPIGAGLYRRELTTGRTTTTLQIGDRPDGLYTVDGLPLPIDEGIAQAGMTFLKARVGASVFYEIHGSRQRLRQTLQFVMGF